MGTYTSAEIAARTSDYWLTRTRAGLVLAFAAVLGLLVGGVITAQTFYAAAAASWRELAVLRALGIPRRHVAGLLLMQALAVASVGLTLAVPLTLAISWAGTFFNVQAEITLRLAAVVATVVLTTAMLAAVTALRSLRLAEPEALLR